MAESDRQPLATRIALAEQRIEGHGFELQRVRERVHMVEGDRAAIRLVVGELRRLRKDIPAIAEAAATKAVALALDTRDDETREDRRERRAGFSFVLQVVGALIGAAGFVYGLVTALSHLN